MEKKFVDDLVQKIGGRVTHLFMITIVVLQTIIMAQTGIKNISIWQLVGTIVLALALAILILTEFWSKYDRKKNGNSLFFTISILFFIVVTQMIYLTLH